MIIDIGDVIYWEGVPHKVKEIENSGVNFIADNGYQTFLFENVYDNKIPIYPHMMEDSDMHYEIMTTFYKIDNQIMPLSMARDIRIDQILND